MLIYMNIDEYRCYRCIIKVYSRLWGLGYNRFWKGNFCCISSLRNVTHHDWAGKKILSSRPSKTGISVISESLNRYQ